MASFTRASGNGIFAGRDEDDVAPGGLGNDRLTSGEGSDILRRYEGADTLNGGAGDDDLFLAGRYATPTASIISTTRCRRGRSR